MLILEAHDDALLSKSMSVEPMVFSPKAPLKHLFGPLKASKGLIIGTNCATSEMLFLGGSVLPKPISMMNLWFLVQEHPYNIFLGPLEALGGLKIYPNLEFLALYPTCQI